LTKYINLKGKVKWCKCYEPETYSGDERWIVSFYPEDEKEWKKFEESGLQLEPKEDNEGERFIRIRRGVKKLFPRDDEITRFAPPTIRGAVNVSYVDEKTNQPVKSFKKSDGVTLKTVGDQTLIGNDSRVIINLAVYPTGQGN